MASPYIAEVQTARWTSDSVRQAFHDVGFGVREWPMTQYLEKQLPADTLFFSAKFSKLFGFQYKTLYRNGADHWRLERRQHRRLQRYPWIYYCCSELRDPTDHPLALHFARIYKNQFSYQAKLTGTTFSHDRGGYVRWGAFYQQLKRCRAGIQIRDRNDLNVAVGSLTGEARLREVVQLGDVFLADYRERMLWAERLF